MLSIFLTSFIPFFGLSQDCQNATHISPQTPFTWYEQNGQAFVTFRASTQKIKIGANWDIAAAAPTSYALLEGDCSSFTTIDSGEVFLNDEPYLNFMYSNLTIGSTYYLKIEGLPGTGFTLDGNLVELLTTATGNCNPIGSCFKVPNPGFETPDNFFNMPVGGEFIANNPTAFVDEACGWEIASTHPNVTPDYYLAPRNAALYGACTPSGNGNSCTAFGNTSNGAAHLFTIDIDASSNPANRREYIYTELQNFIQGTGQAVYALSVSVRHNIWRTARCGALQVNFTNNFTPVTHNQVITTLGPPEVDFSNQISLTDVNWQNLTAIFQNNMGTNVAMVVGNFYDNPQTNGFLNANSPTTRADHIPSLFVDDFELVELPNAGNDLVLCAPGNVSLGIYNPCSSYPKTLTTTWFDAAGNNLGSAIPLNINLTTPGVNTYRLQIQYDNQVFNDFVTVTVVPELATQTTNEDNCDNLAQFEIANLQNWISHSFTSPGATVSWTGNPTISGNTLTFNNPIVNAPNGIGTIVGSVSFTTNGVVCTKNITLTLHQCCRIFTEDFTLLTNGSNISATLGTSNLNITGQVFSVYGDVTVDASYVFNNCEFYLMQDARLIIANNEYVTFEESTLEPCGNLRWDEVLVSPQAYLIFQRSNLSGALRGIHVLNEAALDCGLSTFTNNYCSIFLDQCNVNNPFIEVYNNDFVCEGFNHGGISQATSSIVPMANPQNYITGIMALNCADLTLGNVNYSPNNFTTTSPLNNQVKTELSYINLHNSKNISIVHNQFGFAAAAVWARSQSSYTIGGSLANANTFAPHTFTPAATAYTGNGIKADASFGTISFNDFVEINNAADFSNLELTNLPFFGATEVTDNHIDASLGLQFSLPQSTGSRIRIINNTINSTSKAIGINGYTNCDLPATDRIFISNNVITLTAPAGSNTFKKGIELINTNCVTIGDNTISVATGYTPPGSHVDVVGIHLKQSASCRLSLNNINRFNYGLLMEDEDGTTRYSCLNFNTCYTSVLYKHITATNVQPVRNFYAAPGSGGTSSGNTFINNINTNRVDADFFTFSNTGGPEDYDFDGIIGGIQDPKLSFYATKILLPLAKLPGICGSLPSSKTNDTITSNALVLVKIFPNPSQDGQFTFQSNQAFSEGKIRIFSSTGAQIAEINLVSQVQLFQINPVPGLYVLAIEIDNVLSYDKVAITTY